MTELQKLGISKKIQNALEAGGITTAHSIIKSSPYDLMKIASLTEQDIFSTKNAAAIYIENVKLISAADVLKEKCHQRLSVGCSEIDKFLNGGISARGITEIVGESGSGKTQLCLQLCLMVQYPIESGGLIGGAVYICTEGAFPSARLHQLSTTFPVRHQNSTMKPKPNIVFGDGIFIEHIADADSLMLCVMKRLPQLLRRTAVKLVIIDSIAGVFRADYDPSQCASRAKELQKIGVQLHKLSKHYDLAVVCVNQVTDVPNAYKAEGRKSVACLGLAWANVVTNRLQLTRTSAQLRKLEVIFSPYLPTDSCYYNVTEAGIESVS